MYIFDILQKFSKILQKALLNVKALFGNIHEVHRYCIKSDKVLMYLSDLCLRALKNML